MLIHVNQIQTNFKNKSRLPIIFFAGNISYATKPYNWLLPPTYFKHKTIYILYYINGFYLSYCSDKITISGLN